MRALSVLGMRVGGMVVAPAAVVVLVFVIRTAGVVVAECHALRGRDRRHPLERKPQDEERDGKNAEKAAMHRLGNCTPGG
jgi:hypothetical protein